MPCHISGNFEDLSIKYNELEYQTKTFSSEQIWRSTHQQLNECGNGKENPVHSQANLDF